MANRAERRAAQRSGEAPAIPKVVVGVIHPGQVSMTSMASINRAREHMLQYGMLPGFLELRARPQHVFKARNELVMGFMATDCDYLFFVDSDMGLPRNAIERLLSVAHKDERPIVAGLYFGQRDTGFDEYDHSSSFDIVPHIHLWNFDDNGEIASYSYAEYPRGAVCQIDSTGAGCVLIHRSVFEKIGGHWFSPKPHPTLDQFGEDVSFFMRCHEHGIPVHMDTSVKASHDKGGVFLTEEMFDFQQLLRAEAQRAELTPYLPGVRDARIGVVIPVKDKLELTKHVVEQCLADPGVAEIVVVNNGSTDGTAEYLARADGVWVIDMPDAGIHEMWNVGVADMLSDNPHLTSVAILNNDLDLGFEALSECDAALSVEGLTAVCPNYDGRPSPAPRQVQLVNDICADRYDGTGGLAGFAMVVDADWFRSGYRFPEDCKWWYGDNDLVASVLTAGQRCGIVLDATVEHLDGGRQTGDWSSPEMKAITAADREAFMAKWG